MSFNKFPYIKIDSDPNDIHIGWDTIAKQLNKILSSVDGKKTIVIECYQGVYYDKILHWIIEKLKFDILINTIGLMKSEEQIREMTHTDVTDDRIFGFMTRLNMIDFFDHQKIEQTKDEIQLNNGIKVIFGYGASLLVDNPDILVYADMARWEIQQRMRRKEVDNLGINNKEEGFEAKYKRGFFVDWRAQDRLKRKLMHQWDYVLDTNDHDNPKLVDGSLMRKALKLAAKQPFSLMPFFDPGPWGGQWMKEVCDLNKDADNYAWCFNCVPEENSLLFKFNDTLVEIPSINLVFYQPVELLGDAVHARFGDEFPIRFDFLDTMDGGNLSLQVHPLTEYIQEQFGIHYTQDESYYLMDAKPGAKVYLGLREGVNPQQMMDELDDAQNDNIIFDAEKHVQTWDVKKHDHVLIPGGTVHCSGIDSMVLEISSTPYIFTFKLWDWGRVGLDGKPRPINLNHGKNVIQWDRTTSWTKKNLVNRIEKINEGDGWVEERTGLHEREFIETRRFWFSKITNHDTKEGVHVLNLVEGEEAIVKSPNEAFEPFIIHYAETFIVPAKVGKYSIKPYGKSVGKTIGIIKAYVRT